LLIRSSDPDLLEAAWSAIAVATSTSIVDFCTKVDSC
jgi:hypothetical protein